MHTCREHRGCREAHPTSTALRTAYVGRITPCSYSVRQAIDLYRNIQDEDENQPFPAIVTVLG